MLRFRTTAAAGMVVLSVPLGMLIAYEVGSATGISTSVVVCSALAILVSWPVSRPRLPAVGIGCATVSLVVTAYVTFTDATVPSVARNLGPVELAGVYLLLVLVVRWVAPVRRALVIGGLLWMASVVWVLRLMSELDLLGILGGCASASLPATVAVVAGGYPRYAARRQRELIAAARQEQRLELAHDLHDFVAHDLTAIVAQAQAAQFARADDVQHLGRVLARIESVGLEALDTMDRFVHMLKDRDRDAETTPALSDIPAVVERFRAERAPECAVVLEMGQALDAVRLPRQHEATAHRVVVEGLTNVRRHAAAATRVSVLVDFTSDGQLRVQVTNKLCGASDGVSRRRTFGGNGLSTLQERVASLGGQLAAGPDGNGQWRLLVLLPAGSGGDGHGRTA